MRIYANNLTYLISIFYKVKVLIIFILTHRHIGHIVFCHLKTKNYVSYVPMC
jgi:hypothetical protein